ncbi:UNVERIFIED_CONTAM: hypothetical protein Sradi_0235000 [Sesamum radiatum]|uniref:Uncharacterized protein n=1 Tax=Sesamum radiatum TaxID=300843 RepID=A0AAW2W398_SESRA
MEIRYKASKQEVERAVVACEGDLEKAEETLKAQKQEPPATPPKPEETGDPPTVSNGKLPVASSQHAMRVQTKPISSAVIPQKRDEKDFNYTKVPVTVGPSVDTGTKNMQALKKIPAKLEWTKSQQVTVSSEKRWPSSGSNPSVSYSLASPLQASPPPSKTEARYLAVGNELKNLQLGSVREPVIVMQRPQSINAKQVPSSSVSSSPPGPGGGWFPSGVDTVKPNGGNASPTLSAASSLGLFSGLGANGSSGSSSPVDWNTGGSMLQFDYTNIDWSLDLGTLTSRPNGLWGGANYSLQNNSRTYDSFAYGLGVKSAMRPVLSNGNGGSISGLQEGLASSEQTAGGSREWTSPFEERDLFSLPRQFVSSPSL